MGFTGLTPAAVTLLALRFQQAADALEEAASDAAAAATLSALDDEGLPAGSRAMAMVLRDASHTLTGRADYLSGYILPGIEVAQVVTPTPPPGSQPVTGAHFMDQIPWFLASQWNPRHHITGTEFKGGASLDAFGAAIAAGWQVDIRQHPDGSVEVRMTNSAEIALSGGTPSLDGPIQGQARWQYPITWALPGFGRLLPNSGAYAQTFSFPSYAAYRAFWDAYVQQVATSNIDLTDNASVGLAMIAFSQLYAQTYGTGPTGYTVDFGQSVSFLAELGLRAPVDRLLGGGSFDPATGQFLNDLAAALDGEASGQLNYGFSIDRYTTPEYQVMGMAFPMPQGWATTAWLRAEADAQLRASGRVLLFGEAIGAQIEADVRAGIVFDRWGEARQIVLRATVTGYEFPGSRTLCIPIAPDVWLKVTHQSWSLIPENEAELMLGSGDAVVRVIEFERTINLDSARAIAQAQMQHQIEVSGLDRLNIAIAQDPGLQADVDEALRQLEDLTGIDVPAQQWQAILEQTMRPADPWNEPAEQIAGLVAGTPLGDVPEPILRAWAQAYLHPIARHTGNSRGLAFWWSDGLTPFDIGWAAEHRIAAMSDAEVAEYLAATGLEPDGWEVATYEGTERVSSADLQGSLSPFTLAQSAAAYFNGQLEAQRLDYQQIGHWRFTDADYQNLIALMMRQPEAAVLLLQMENRITEIPTP